MTSENTYEARILGKTDVASHNDVNHQQLRKIMDDVIYSDSWTANPNGMAMAQASVVVNPERLRPHHALLRQIAPITVRFLFENFGSIVRVK